MQILDVAQGSQEWHEARLGLVTASRFRDVLTQPRAKKDQEAGKLSEVAMSYLCELVAETLTGEHRSASAAALDWGHENEPLARLEYELTCGVDVTETGIVIHDNGLIGASSDGFIGGDGAIEIKCPYNPAVHLKTVLSGEMPKEHIPQVQGNLWLAERDWCDFISFDPRIPQGSKARLFVVRVHRDDDYIKMLSERVLAFAELVESKVELIK